MEVPVASWPVVRRGPVHQSQARRPAGRRVRPGRPAMPAATGDPQAATAPGIVICNCQGVALTVRKLSPTPARIGIDDDEALWRLPASVARGRCRNSSRFRQQADEGRAGWAVFPMVDERAKTGNRR